MSNIGRIFLLFYSSLQDTDRARAFEKYYEGDFSCQTFPQSLLEDCEEMMNRIFNNQKRDHDIVLEPEIERAAIRYAEYDCWIESK